MAALPKPPVALWRAVRADPTAFYDAELIARSKAYQRPLHRARLINGIIELAFIVLIVGFKVVPRLTSSIGSWPIRLLVAFLLLAGGLRLLSLPVTIWRVFGHDRRWGFSTTTPKRFVGDQLKGLLIGLPLIYGLLLAIWSVIRATDLWWLYGALILSAFGVVVQFLFPVLFLPLFYKSRPLEDGDLKSGIERLAASVGARIRAVSVIDASKRSTKDNAAVTGLGKTKRVLVFDTMLERPHEQIEVVIGHEFGHWRRHHNVIGLIEGFVGGPLLFGLLALILSWDPLLRWAGVKEVAEPAALALFALVFGLLQSVLGYQDYWESRWHERTADFDSLELTRDVDSYRSLWRAIPEKDLPDLTPSWWRRLKLTHPPAYERLAFADVWEAARAGAVKDVATGS